MERVSVVLPVYNGARFLAETIESVLAQTGAEIELIVVDDGSKDTSAEIASSMGAKVIRKPNGGLAAARNTGIEAARAPLVALIDDDDLWGKEKLAKQLAALAADPGAELCTTRFCYFLSPEIVMPASGSQVEPGVPQDRSCPSAWLLRRSVFERVGLFDPSYRLAEDIEWLGRARDAGARTIALQDCLVSKRVHDTNISGQHAASHQLAISALRASVARKRAAAEGAE